MPRSLLGDAYARRYPADIGPLSGIPEQSVESYASLAQIADRGGAGFVGAVALFLQEPPRLPEGWTLLRGGILDQMIAPQPLPLAPVDLPGVELRRLTTADAPAMVELAHLTEPGPFQLRTLELGTFYGILQSGACSPWLASAFTCQAPSRSAAFARIPTLAAAAMPATSCRV